MSSQSNGQKNKERKKGQTLHALDELGPWSSSLLTCPQHHDISWWWGALTMTQKARVFTYYPGSIFAALFLAGSFDISSRKHFWKAKEGTWLSSKLWLKSRLWHFGWERSFICWFLLKSFKIANTVIWEDSLSTRYQTVSNCLCDFFPQARADHMGIGTIEQSLTSKLISSYSRYVEETGSMWRRQLQTLCHGLDAKYPSKIPVWNVGPLFTHGHATHVVSVSQ